MTEEIKSFKIKGLPDDHMANYDLSDWMNKKVCANCGCEHRLYTRNSQECSHCHNHIFTERWKFYKIEEKNINDKMS